jgi:hypothetical protein
MRKPIRSGIRRLLRLSIRTPPITASDIDAEISSRLEQRIDALIALGYSRENAIAEAR